MDCLRNSINIKSKILCTIHSNCIGMPFPIFIKTIWSCYLWKNLPISTCCSGATHQERIEEKSAASESALAQKLTVPWVRLSFEAWALRSKKTEFALKCAAFPTLPSVCVTPLLVALFPADELSFQRLLESSKLYCTTGPSPGAAKVFVWSSKTPPSKKAPAVPSITLLKGQKNLFFVLVVLVFVICIIYTQRE